MKLNSENWSDSLPWASGIWAWQQGSYIGIVRVISCEPGFGWTDEKGGYLCCLGQGPELLINLKTFWHKLPDNFLDLPKGMK